MDCDIETVFDENKKIKINEVENISLFDEQGASNFNIYFGKYKNNNVIIKSIKTRCLKDKNQQKENFKKFSQDLGALELQYYGMVYYYGWGDDFDNSHFMVIEMLNHITENIDNKFKEICYKVFYITRKLYLKNLNWTTNKNHILCDKNGDIKIIDFNDDNDFKKSFLNSNDCYDYSVFLKNFIFEHGTQLTKKEIEMILSDSINKVIVDEYQSLDNVHQPIFFTSLKDTFKKETDPNDSNFGKLVPANRTCTDRAILIKENIEIDIKGKTLFDFGTNVGWFCYYFNDLGMKTKGVDFDLNKIKFNTFLSEKFNVDCVFEFMEISLDSVKKMQSYDIVLGLSIFHLFFTQHKYSKESWIELMAEVCKKAKKYFIIEVSSDVFSALDIGSFYDFSNFIKGIGNFKSSKIIGNSVEGRPLILCER